ncbi:MAG: hypothetical protein R3Y43_07230 [Alphaproteobacteria bacterium]
MKRENKYIGDEAFNKMLKHYECPTPLSVITMRFAGSICSPNKNLRPAEVISSFWEDGKTPRLQTKEEADLFFKFFMGLWDEVFENVFNNNIKLSKQSFSKESSELRFEELELGFIEGFFGGLTELKIPAYIGEISNNISELALSYKKVTNADTFNNLDKMTTKAINFLIESYVHKKTGE